MIIVHTSSVLFLNDLSEVIRLFYPSEEIVFPAEPSVETATYAQYEDNAPIRIALSVFMTDGCIRAEAHSGPFRAFCSSEEFGTYAQIDKSVSFRRMEKWTSKCSLYRLLSEMNGIRMPWGALTGIRPSKLFRDLAEKCGEEKALEIFSDAFGVSEEKRSLASRICAVQKPFISATKEKEIDLYFHVPFCRSRCLYCSFGTELVSGKDTLREYTDAIKRDIRRSAAVVRENGYKIRCTYFGGGTPSILPPELLDDLLTCILSEYGTLGAECTFEAGRPDTIDAEKLAVLKSYGVGRISINPQSMHVETLERIGRRHTVDSLINVFRLARSMGFSWINMDLIMGLPGESFSDMKESIDSVLSLSPENITIHTLAIKRTSMLKHLQGHYSMASAPEVEKAVRYGYLSMIRNGFEPYYMYRQKYMQGNLENVGYAKPGKTSLYNIDIMEETVGIMAHGAGSISKAVAFDRSRIERVAAPKDPFVYVSKMDRLISEKRDLFNACMLC